MIYFCFFHSTQLQVPKCLTKSYQSSCSSNVRCSGHWLKMGWIRTTKRLPMARDFFIFYLRNPISIGKCVQWTLFMYLWVKITPFLVLRWSLALSLFPIPLVLTPLCQLVVMVVRSVVVCSERRRRLPYSLFPATRATPTLTLPLHYVHIGPCPKCNGLVYIRVSQKKLFNFVFPSELLIL